MLTGCADSDPTAEPLPPLTEAPSPTPSRSGLALPDLPPEAEGASAAAATAFARYYFETVVVQAFQDNDPTLLAALSAPDCGTCANLVADVERQRDAGERLEGTDYEVLGAVAPAVDSPEVIVDIRYATAEGRLLFSDGRPPDEIEARPAADMQVLVERQGEMWKVGALRFFDGEEP